MAESHRCWRCQRDVAKLIADPMMPKRDRIGICESCAVQREHIRRSRPSADMSGAPG